MPNHELNGLLDEIDSAPSAPAPKATLSSVLDEVDSSGGSNAADGGYRRIGTTRDESLGYQAEDAARNKAYRDGLWSSVKRAPKVMGNAIVSGTAGLGADIHQILNTLSPYDERIDKAINPWHDPAAYERSRAATETARQQAEDVAATYGLDQVVPQDQQTILDKSFYGAAQSLPSMAATLPIGGAVPGKSAIVKEIVQAAAQDAISQPNNYKKAVDAGQDPADAMRDALVSPLIEGAGTFVGGKLGGKLASKVAGRTSLGIGDIYGLGAKELAETTRGTMLEAAKRLGQGAAAGAISETTEESLVEAGHSAYTLMQKNPSLTWEQAVENVMVAGISGGLLGAPMAAAGGHSYQAEAQRSRESVDAARAVLQGFNPAQATNGQLPSERPQDAPLSVTQQTVDAARNAPGIIDQLGVRGTAKAAESLQPDAIARLSDDIANPQAQRLADEEADTSSQQIAAQEDQAQQAAAREETSRANADLQAAEDQATEERRAKREQEHQDIQGQISETEARLRQFDEPATEQLPRQTPLEKAIAKRDAAKRTQELRQGNSPDPVDFRAEVRESDAIDAVREAGGIDMRAKSDELSVLPPALKRAIKGSGRGTPLDALATQIAGTHGIGDGTARGLSVALRRAHADRAKVAKNSADNAAKQRAENNAAKAEQAAIEAAIDSYRAGSPGGRAAVVKNGPYLTKEEAGVVAALKKRVADLKKRQADMRSEDSIKPIKAPVPAVAAKPSPVEQAAPPKAPPQPARTDRVMVNSVADLHRGLREIYKLSEEKADNLITWVKHRAASLGVDADAFVRQHIGEVRQGESVKKVIQEVKAQAPATSTPDKASPPAPSSVGPLAEFDAETKARTQQIKASYIADQKAGRAGAAEERARQLKGYAMRRAAERRKLVQGEGNSVTEGGLTPKERANERQRLEGNYNGKPVTLTNGQRGTVVGTAFGKIRVKGEDGTVRSVAPEDIKKDNLLYQDNTRLNAPGESLAFNHMKRQWEKAHGERLQPQSESWQQLQERAAKVDAKRGMFYQKKSNGEKGAVSFGEDGRAVLHALNNPDVSTAIHELFHVFRRTVTGRDADLLAHWAGAKKQANGSWLWTTKAEEKVARAGEQYTRDGVAPVPALRSVFDKFRTWMREIYQKIEGSPIDVQITPEVRQVFDRMFTPAKGQTVAANNPAQSTTAKAVLSDIEFKDMQVWNEATQAFERKTGSAQVVDLLGRKIVLATVNGVRVPFYLSTGHGGKKNVQAGKWYPFFGVSSEAWINKGTEAEINDYYGSPDLRAMAEHLDKTMGDVSGAERVSVTGAGASINQALTELGLSPVNNSEADTVTRLAANKAAILEAIRSGKAAGDTMPSSEPLPAQNAQETAKEALPRTRETPLAVPATDRAQRDKIQELDEAREKPETRKQEHVHEAARRQVANDPQGERKRILDKARDGTLLNDLDTAVAQEILRQDTQKALASGNEKAIADLAATHAAYRDTGTEVARSLAIRKDPAESPAHRHIRMVTDAILTPPKPLRDAMQKQRSIAQAADAAGQKEDAANARAQLAKLNEQAASRLKRVRSFFAKEGIDLLYQGDNVDYLATMVNAASKANGTANGVLREFWINSILSGARTLMVNAAAVNAMWKLGINRFAESAINSATGGKNLNASTMREYRIMWKGLIPGIQRGWSNAVRSFSAERAILNGEMDGQTQLDGHGPQIAGTKGRVIRSPTRLLLAADQFNKTWSAHVEVMGHAYRLARKQLGPDAKEDALVGRMHELVNDLESPAWDIAKKLADEHAFQGELPKAVKTAMSIRDAKIPGTDLRPLFYIVPFIKTPANVIGEGLKASPLGMARLLWKIGNDKRGAAHYDRSEMAKDAAQQIVSFGISAIMAAMAGMTDDDDLPYLTGAEGAYAPGKAGVASATRPPYTMRIPGTKVELDYRRIEPFATWFALVADATRIAKRSNQGEATGDTMSGLKDAVAAQVLDKSMLKSLSDLYKAFAPGKNPSDWAKNFATSWIPNVIRAPLRDADSTERETDAWGQGSDFWKMYFKRMGQTVAPWTQTARINLLGDEIKKSDDGPLTDTIAMMTRIASPSVVTMAKRPEDLYRWLTNWNNNGANKPWFPAQPAKEYTLRGERKYFTEEQYEKMQRRAGAILKERLDVLSEDKDLALTPEKPTAVQRKRLEKLIQISRKIARGETLRAKTESGDDAPSE